MITTLAIALAMAPAVDVKVEVLKAGKGMQSAKDDVVTVSYKGTLKDGTVFDETGKEKPPFAFKLGAGQVIVGWDKGLVGRKIGDRLKLTIPPELAYGPRDRTGIPANSTLTFDVQVLRIDKKDGKQVAEIEEIKAGTGQPVRKGEKATIHYKGTFLNGHKFDASYDRNEPFTFTIGSGDVIRGFDEGVAGMKAGGKRRVTIPYGLAYGENGRPPVIPRMATLVFELELIKRG